MKHCISFHCQEIVFLVCHRLRWQHHQTCECISTWFVTSCRGMSETPRLQDQSMDLQIESFSSAATDEIQNPETWPIVCFRLENSPRALTCVARSIGSPILIFLVRSNSWARNVSRMSSCTKTRVAFEHTSPCAYSLQVSTAFTRKSGRHEYFLLLVLQQGSEGELQSTSESSPCSTCLNMHGTTYQNPPFQNVPVFSRNLTLTSTGCENSLSKHLHNSGGVICSLPWSHEHTWMSHNKVRQRHLEIHLISLASADCETFHNKHLPLYSVIRILVRVLSTCDQYSGK